MSFQIHIAKNISFCGGVKRATQEMEKRLLESEGKEDTRYTLSGQLIHNERYHLWLEQKGVKYLDSHETLPITQEEKKEVFVIQTHGMAPDLEQEYKNQFSELVDLTCPVVKNIQKKVQEAEKENYQVILIGKKNHPEVNGLMGYATNAIVLETEKEIDEFVPESNRAYALISQSTLGKEKFDLFSQKLAEKIPNLKNYHTLCPAPLARQKEMDDFVLQHDMIFVVGGKKSSNTKELYERAKAIAPEKPIYHIQGETDILNISFEGIKNVGITSGTSTPLFIIQEVQTKLEQISQAMTSEVSIR